jgi:UDP-galactopyranose mutase
VTLPAADIVCFSHLRWNFVYQRPNHLMTHAANGHRVYFVEEPERRGSTPRIEASMVDGVMVVKPILPEDTWGPVADLMLRDEIDRFFVSERIEEPWLWYYTPMALNWTAHLRASAVIYDCMDELSNFKFAPPNIRDLENQLIARADVVFTGGRSLYEAKRHLHPSMHCFPSSVDAAHFRKARDSQPDPNDQAGIAHPRIGYHGVIDERIDLDLLAAMALRRPDWNFVMLGPLAKIADEDVPKAANIHWLGLKQYNELPAYLAGWDVAMMPFALNDSTRFISPTKTPEYLAGGRPVVSTAITDVVRPYGDEGLVSIAHDADEFVAAIDQLLTSDRAALARRADAFLATQSWKATWSGMEGLIEQLRPVAPVIQLPAPVPAPVPLFPPKSARVGDGRAVRTPSASLAVGGRSRPR